MNVFTARNLKRGQWVTFTPLNITGRIVSVLADFVSIDWTDGTASKLHVDDFEDVQFGKSSPQPITAAAGESNES
jgi:hypothetical protein